MKSNRNRLANTKNIFQGDRKKVLCVCSAGILRSPTIAWILSNKPFDYNTRACGCNPEYALIPLDDALITWADTIVVVEPYMVDVVESFEVYREIICIPTPDVYGTRDPELIKDLLPKLEVAFNV